MGHFLLYHTPLWYLIQSFWRDEAFSVIFAQMPLWEIIQKTTVEPPLYYFLLHFWIKIFGTSEIAARSLSFVAVIIACIVLAEWAHKIFKDKFFSLYMSLFFLCNPMILYYAFEVRTYGFFILFTVLSLFFYHEKKWGWYRIATICGIYTHFYFGVVPLIQGIHYGILHRQQIFRKVKHIPVFIQSFFRDPMGVSYIIIALAISPMFVRFLTVSSVFKSSWFYPVDFHLIKSVLGNMFIGYEGTPWYLWPYTAYLSILLFVLFIVALKDKTHRSLTGLLFFLISIPLTLVIGVSFIKPFFVNRYLIPVSVAEVLLTIFALSSLKPKALQRTIAIVFLVAVCVFDMWFSDKHNKLDIRTPVSTINAIKKPSDFIYVDDPIVFMETLYYTKDTSKFRYYNPTHQPFPWFIGDTIVKKEHMTDVIPVYPIKAYIVGKDGSVSVVSEAPYKNP